MFLLLFSCSNNPARHYPLTEKEFTAVFLDSLKKRHPESSYVIEKELQIRAKSSDKDFIHYLDNAYNLYKAQPDSMVPVMQMYLASSSDLYLPEEPISRKRIVAVIKDAGYMDEVKQVTGNLGAKKAAEYMFEKYNEKLIVLYGEDKENGIAYFTKDEFLKTGIPEDSLYSIATRNLDSLLTNVQRNGDKGVFMITAGGTYEASLILAAYLWTKENMPVDGDPIIAIPTRDLLLVTGSHNKAGIDQIKIMASNAWQDGPYQLTNDLFIRKGDKFVLYR